MLRPRNRGIPHLNFIEDPHIGIWPRGTPKKQLCGMMSQ
jgi:hypothetical protein